MIDNAELARISKKLVTLDDNVPLDVPVDQLGVHEPDYKNLIAFLKTMGFKTLTQRVADAGHVDATAVETGEAGAVPGSEIERGGSHGTPGPVASARARDRKKAGSERAARF